MQVNIPWNSLRWRRRLLRLQGGRRIRSMDVVVAVALVAAMALACGSLRRVDFEPRVHPNFFFSQDDPLLTTQQQIDASFEAPVQLVISAKGDVSSLAYQQRIDTLTAQIAALPGVVSILSLAKGPRNLADATRSPLWQRLLLADHGKASNIIVFIPEHAPRPLMAQIEDVVARAQSRDFQVVMSGVPYVVELMRRALMRDLRIFSLVTLLIFGSLILLAVRSLRLVLGMLMVCVTAAAATLFLNHLLGIRVGLLTANLATIVFTLTLSHLVFLTCAWHHEWRRQILQRRRATLRAVRLTMPPSFWSMLTTLLGFGSLWFVQAEPLRKLGLSGMVGTVAAFLVAYGMYPWVLWRSRPKRPAATLERAGDLQRLFVPRHPRVVAAIIVGCLAVATGLFRLQKDPSLLSYFDEDSTLRQGLEYIDRNLGSSPLMLVVRDLQHRTFASTKMYQRLWELHSELEQLPGVGSVISLPVLMAEARRVPLVGALLPWNWLLDLMELPIAHQVGKYFVTDDRTQGMFLMLMQESQRQGSRLEMVEQLREATQRHDFAPHLIGGTYVLQGKLAQLVVSSLLWGLGLLLALFGGLAVIIARSWRVAMAMLVSILLIPLWMLGIIGHFRVPFDVISSPAANLAVAMGVDAMIHLLIAARRARAHGQLDWQAWVTARAELWQPILLATLVVCAGFAVCGVSVFPPTRRFGLSIVLGTMLVPWVTLLVLPALATPRARVPEHADL